MFLKDQFTDNRDHLPGRKTANKINLKEFLQEQKLNSKRETWAILRSFGYSSLISCFIYTGPHYTISQQDVYRSLNLKYLERSYILPDSVATLQQISIKSYDEE